jgi:DNA polymerase-1
VENLKEVQEQFEQDQPTILAWDTETSGLHILKDRAFLYQFGWRGKVFEFYPSLANLTRMLSMMKKAKIVFGHNVKYDLHMLANDGFDINGVKWADTMTLARLVLDIVPDDKDFRHIGLSLKELGAKLIDKNANESQKLIKENLNKLKNERIKPLTTALKQFKTGQLTPKGKDQYWGKGLIEKFLKDPTNDLEDLPQDVREVWETWQREYPEPTYEDVDRELMLVYGGIDIVITLELVYKFLSDSTYKKRFEMQRPIFEQECDCIYPFFKMERVGFRMDREYLEESRKRVKAYIIKQRNKLVQLLGEEVTVGQHETLKKIFASNWGIELESADKPSLKKVIEVFEGECVTAAKLIIELRSLEKWYKTYIIRLIDSSSYDGKSYTQVNLSGAVSGRVSSDFQQFPKDSLVDDEGNELFHPRKAILVNEGYDYICYLDFSQIELREQANYTLLVSGGDLNLCRAYFPFKCKSTLTGEIYNWKNRFHIRRWNSGEWVDEQGKVWEKTDVHSLTTHNTLMALGYKCLSQYEKYRFNGEGFFGNKINEKEFAKVRYKGKLFNFARNYGGGVGVAMKSLDLPRNVAEALVEGYSRSFPKVEDYQKSVVKAYTVKGYVVNHYGRHYFLHKEFKRQAYKLGNYLIQGTCADQLKKCIIQLNEFLEREGYKSRIIIPIHDEIQFAMVKEELWLIREFLNIMQYMDSKHFVPIVSDIELTTTNWAEKYNVTREEIGI